MAKHIPANPELSYKRLLARLRAAAARGKCFDWTGISEETIQLIEDCEEFFCWGGGESLIALQYPGSARKRRAFYRLDFEIPWYGGCLAVDFVESIDWGYFYTAFGNMSDMEFSIRPLDGGWIPLNEAKQMAEDIFDALDNHDPLWDFTLSEFDYYGRHLHVMLAHENTVDPDDYPEELVGKLVFHDCRKPRRKVPKIRKG